VISGCYNTASNPSGQLRVIDTQAGGKCAKNEQALSWNQQGPKATKATQVPPEQRAQPAQQALLALPRPSGSPTSRPTHSQEATSRNPQHDPSRGSSFTVPDDDTLTVIGVVTVPAGGKAISMWCKDANSPLGYLGRYGADLMSVKVGGTF